MRRYVVMVAFAAGCGGSPPPSPPSNAPPPAPVTAIGDTLVDHLRAYRDDMCACANGGCAREVGREMKRWHDHHKDLDGRPRSADAEPLEHQIASCEATAKAKADGDDMEVAMKRFTTEMCTCADAASADCAKKVTDEMTKWAVANAEKAGDRSDRPTEEETQTIKQFTECATRAMMAGVQQPTGTP
jgi:hypothetical protein